MAKHGDRGEETDTVVEDAARATALDRYLAARLAPRPEVLIPNTEGTFP